jgi:hypothetical protein
MGGQIDMLDLAGEVRPWTGGTCDMMCVMSAKSGSGRDYGRRLS